MRFDNAYLAWPGKVHAGVVKLAPDEFRREMGKLFAERTRDEDAWLLGSLADDRRKWFAAAVLEASGGVPRTFFDAMVRAAVHERNPSFNRTFVEPLTHAHGHRRVIEALLNFLDGGTNAEKAGSARALYWAWPALAFNGVRPAFTAEHATPESRIAWEQLADLWLREQLLKLREFVANDDLEVRQCIIPSLCLSASAYPPASRAQVREAIRIGQGHSDEDVRHRTGVQLGNAGALMPLPPQIQT